MDATDGVTQGMRSPVRALSARHDAVEGLVSEHQSSVRGFLSFLGCPPPLLDDLVQDVFLTVLRTDFELRSRPEAASYLRKVAKNLFLKSMRRQRQRPPMRDLDAAEQVWVEYEAEDGGSRYLDALRECLARLGRKAHTILRLRYTESLARASIAERLDMTESGVNSVLVRMRKRLRTCVEEKVQA